MKTPFLCLIAAVAAFASPVLAKDADSPSSRATACTQEATGLKGEERERFVAACRKKGEADGLRQAKAPAPEGQQNRMKRCNVEAGKRELKGDERRAFMSACLKG